MGRAGAERWTHGGPQGDCSLRTSDQGALQKGSWPRRESLWILFPGTGQRGIFLSRGVPIVRDWKMNPTEGPTVCIKREGLLLPSGPM